MRRIALYRRELIQIRNASSDQHRSYRKEEKNQRSCVRMKPPVYHHNYDFLLFFSACNISFSERVRSALLGCGLRRISGASLRVSTLMKRRPSEPRHVFPYGFICPTRAAVKCRGTRGGGTAAAEEAYKKGSDLNSQSASEQTDERTSINTARTQNWIRNITVLSFLIHGVIVNTVCAFCRIKKLQCSFKISTGR